MIIGLPPFPLSVGGADMLSFLSLGNSSLTRIVLVGHYQPLILVSRWPLPVLFGMALGDPGWPMVMCPLDLPVHWVALLRGWLVCYGCDVLWGGGHHLLFI